MAKETEGIHIKPASEVRDEMVEELQADLWEWSKDNGEILEGREISLFIQGWKKGRERNGENIRAK